MNMINFISDSLSGLNVPVLWNLRPKAFPSITFTTYLSRPEDYGDGNEITKGHYIQIDVWAKNDYSTLVDSVRNTMVFIGFSWESESDTFEEETEIYHKVMKFNYIEEVTDNG